MNKSTPGPWHIIGGYNIYSELGGQSGDGTTADARDGWHIASIGEAPTFVDGESVYLGREVQKANARLLAAAPDLLEALIDCVLVMQCELRGLKVIQPELCQAEYAIAKARGEA